MTSEISYPGGTNPIQFPIFEHGDVYTENFLWSYHKYDAEEVRLQFFLDGSDNMGVNVEIRDGISFLEDIETRFFINNEFVPAKSGKFFQLQDPATGEATVQVSDADAADVDDAFEAARQALPSWSSTGGLQRAAYLLKLADLLERDNHILARLEAISMGRPVGTYSTSAFVASGKILTIEPFLTNLT